MKIFQALKPDQIAQARALFAAYAAGLAVDLCLQGFQAELAGLPGKYAPPRGRLLLAMADDAGPAGCVAVRPLSDSFCEMKRLFVRSAFRGQGLGRKLAERAVTEARAANYAGIRLDTVPAAKEALQLYESMGFLPCAPYHEATVSDLIFLELKF